MDYSWIIQYWRQWQHQDIRISNKNTEMMMELKIQCVPFVKHQLYNRHNNSYERNLLAHICILWSKNSWISLFFNAKKLQIYINAVWTCKLIFFKLVEWHKSHPQMIIILFISFFLNMIFVIVKNPYFLKNAINFTYMKPALQFSFVPHFDIDSFVQA